MKLKTTMAELTAKMHATYQGQEITPEMVKSFYSNYYYNTYLRYIKINKRTRNKFKLEDHFTIRSKHHVTQTDPDTDIGKIFIYPVNKIISLEHHYYDFKKINPNILSNVFLRFNNEGLYIQDKPCWARGHQDSWYYKNYYKIIKMDAILKFEKHYYTVLAFANQHDFLYNNHPETNIYQNNWSSILLEHNENNNDTIIYKGITINIKDTAPIFRKIHQYAPNYYPNMGELMGKNLYLTPSGKIHSFDNIDSLNKSEGCDFTPIYNVKKITQNKVFLADGGEYIIPDGCHPIPAEKIIRIHIKHRCLLMTSKINLTYKGVKIREKLEIDMEFELCKIKFDELRTTLFIIKTISDNEFELIDIIGHIPGQNDSWGNLTLG